MANINKQIEAGFDKQIDMNDFFKELLGDEAMQKYIKDKGIKAGKNGSALSFLSHF